MGFFDFLFSHKNKEERLEERRLERQEEAKKQEEARRKVLEEEGVLLSSLTEDEDLEGPQEEVDDLEEDLLLAEEKQGQEADLIKEEKVQEVEEAKEEGAQETEPIKEETKVLEETPQEEVKAPVQEDLMDKPQAPVDFRDLTLLKVGESLDLPSTSKIQKLKVTKVADEFYDLFFESNGFTYERKRIHQDILKNHLENYQKTGSMVLKSFRQ
ncbi:conserved domain protein [Peptoniphilus sp. oral taxon 375 str. F0436]|nr:conserved domain protein [Peptoniphilus sp. oral taxon 375 str. F0436]